MFHQLIFTVLVALVELSISKPLGHDADIGKTPIEMIEGHGYPTETHHATTEDGYILEIYRIPHSANATSSSPGKPVLMVHGLLSSAADYVNMGPDKSLAYLLSNAGYDVWLLNCRGTTFSRGHVTFTDAAQYFNFSWHEMGYYDVPTTIDYILDTTGESKVFYIGHSQGTTAFLITAATRPEYNQKIHLASLMGPAALMESCGETLQFLSKYWKLYELLHLSDAPGIFGAMIRDFGKIFCVDGMPYQELCAELVEDIVGSRDIQELDMERLPAVLTNAPNDAAWKQFIHYAQVINSGKFRYYDHGEKTNMEIYGNPDPPAYDLKKATAPVAVYYSKSDFFVPVEDARRLVKALPNVVTAFEVAYDNFTHLDYLFAKDIIPMLYSEMLNDMANTST